MSPPPPGGVNAGQKHDVKHGVAARLWPDPDCYREGADQRAEKREPLRGKCYDGAARGPDQKRQQTKAEHRSNDPFGDHGAPVLETGSQDARMHQGSQREEERLHQQNEREFRAVGHHSGFPLFWRRPCLSPFAANPARLA